MPSRIAVIKRADVQLVDDGVFVPERIRRAAGPFCHFDTLLYFSAMPSGRKTTTPSGGSVMFSENGRP